MKSNIEKLMEVFKTSPYMLKMGAVKISKRQGVDIQDVYDSKKLFYSKKNTFITNACEELGIEEAQVKSFWVKDKNKSIQVKTNSTSDFKDEILQSFDNLLSKYQSKGIKPFKPTKLKELKALKVTLTDSHVGLNPSHESALFTYEYNAKIYNKSLEKVYNSILKEYNTHGTFDLLVLDDLGDREDGWDGQTTRGGHILEQNMTNAEMFDTCVDGQIRLIESIINANVTNKIILRNVSNSNHSSDFALIVNKAIEKIINKTYHSSIIEVETLEKFIEHRSYGDHTFLLCHGKDSVHQKNGLPLILTDKTINYINNYIDFYNIDSKYIHFEKGDLHQLSYQRTVKFDYRNYMAFSPPSCWQQVNFSQGYSGYSIQVIPKFSGEISHTDYFIDYKKVK